MCDTLMAIIKFNQKLLLGIAACCILLSGIWLIAVGIEAQNSMDFEVFDDFSSAENNDSFHLRDAILAMVIFGFISVIGSFAGCYGVIAENRTAICSFSLILVILFMMYAAVTLVMVGLMMTVGPVVVKETNRICRNADDMKILLKCPASSLGAVSYGTAISMSTNAPTLAPYAYQTGRRLRAWAGTFTTALAASSIKHLGPHAGTVHYFGAQLVQKIEPNAYILRHHAVPRDFLDTPNNRSLFHHSKYLYLLAKAIQQSATQEGRRLEPGQNEMNVLSSVCGRLKAAEDETGEEYCRNECDLVNKLCEAPEGFVEDTACICDAEGPRKRQISGENPFEGDTTGVTGLNYVTAECPDGMVMEMGTAVGGTCKGKSCYMREGDSQEGCYGLASTDCRQYAEMMNTEVTQPFDSEPDVYWATGACEHPDPRSKVIARGLAICVGFIAAIFVFSLFLFFNSLCACCLFFEIHSGKKATRSLIAESEEDEASEADDEESN